MDSFWNLIHCTKPCNVSAFLKCLIVGKKDRIKCNMQAILNPYLGKIYCHKPGQATLLAKIRGLVSLSSLNGLLVTENSWPHYPDCCLFCITNYLKRFIDYFLCRWEVMTFLPTSLV